MACIDAVGFGLLDDNCDLVNNAPESNFPAVEYEWFFWLSVVTAAVCVALAIPRVVYLSRRQSVVLAPLRAPSISLAAKLIASTAFAGLRVGLLVVAIRHPQTSARLVASTALDFTAACLVIALSPLEHFKSRRPSILVCSFLFLTLIYDVARTPLLWNTASDPGQDVKFAGLFTATVVIEFVFLTAESIRPSRWIPCVQDQDGEVETADQAQSPEETSSILSLGLYSWLNPLLWRGYHEPLAMRHLFPLESNISVARFYPDHSKDSSPSKLAHGLSGTSTWELASWLADSKPLVHSLMLPVLPRLCLIGFTFCQPFFLQHLLRFLDSAETSESSTASAFISVAVLTYSGIAISTALYWYYQERFQSLLRAFLISAIYRKAANIHHVGEGDPAAVTLMGTDVERIYTGLRLIQELWANVIQIALATWLLQRELGLAFLAPLVIVALSFAFSFTISRRAVSYQTAWMARVQARIGMTSSVLSRIKDLRVSGMTGPAAVLVQREREDELHVGERSRVLLGISASFSSIPQAVAPALAFAFGPRVLDQTKAFTALSYLALLTSPLLVVLQSLPIIAACIACLRRIKTFLDKEERRTQGLEDVEKHDAGTLRVAGNPEEYISVRGGSLGWTADMDTLINIHLCLPRSSITFVVGPIASGKSTLCRALLGEVPHLKGTVNLGSKKVAYCDQVPFLFNASVMENIVGFSSFDTARYEEVIRVTMLAQDLKELSEGDQTIIGSKGVSLSGGQRQRISLARALYHDADILVLDDVFSGLDGSTQRQVCNAVFGPRGLVRKRGTTVIICTHSMRFLSVADYIVRLSQRTILDKGTLAEIRQDAQRGKRFGLVGPDESQLGSTEKLKSSSEAAELSTADIVSSSVDSLIETTSPRSPHKRAPTGIPAAKSVPSPTVDMVIYRHWLATIGPVPIIAFLILASGVGFCSNFTTIWVKMWSADSTSPSPHHSFAFWIGIYALIGAGSVVCVLPASLIMLRTGVRLGGTHFHHKAINAVMHSSLRFLGASDVGKILNLFSQDMNIMDTQLPRMVNNMIFCLTNAVGQAVVIALSSAWLSISYPFFAGIVWVIQRVYLPTSKRLRLLDLEAKTPLYTNFLDTISGLPTIRAFGWFPEQLARNDALLDDSQRPSYLLAMVQQWLTLTMNILVTIIAVLLVVLATQLGSNAGNVGAGLVTLITLGGTMTNIIMAYTGLETSLGAISRLKSFGEETELEGDGNDDIMPGDDWPSTGCVEMKAVNASYNGTHNVLRDINLVIEAGEKVAICGRTGSGKSSIITLLLRLIDPLAPTEPSSSTTITIDSLPIHTIDRTTLRERIISASQDQVFLPDGTSFRDSLDPWNAASDAECAAVLSDLDLLSVVDAKGGLNTPINGVEFSGGQKQLFSLARAVLRRRVKMWKTGVDGGLLLLDEITSSADAETEMRVRDVLESEFGGYTVVMVTHQRDMALGCGRVVVLDSGCVVEDGRPGELLAKGGWFSRLWDGSF